jgi:hypothetical protein
LSIISRAVASFHWLFMGRVVASFLRGGKGCVGGAAGSRV